jgi:branched-chain amino acid transport system ATP-binding protein
MSLLRVQAVWKAFGGVQAVSGVDFEVQEGELACIIGPNGAGKTTLFNLISGYYRPDRGRVAFDGRDITGVPPHRTARLGLVRSFQKTHVFSEMTVTENIQTMVQFRKHRSLNFLAKATSLERPETRELIEMVGLGTSAHSVAGTLSAGDRKRLELGIALAARPKLLLLDEPTCGMSPAETASTIELIQRLGREQKLTLLFTEHKMDVVFSIAERIAVLHFGRLIAEGTPAEIRANPEVQRVYLGEAT